MFSFEMLNGEEFFRREFSQIGTNVMFFLLCKNINLSFMRQYDSDF